MPVGAAPAGDQQLPGREESCRRTSTRSVEISDPRELAGVGVVDFRAGEDDAGVVGDILYVSAGQEYGSIAEACGGMSEPGINQMLGLIEHTRERVIELGGGKRHAVRVGSSSHEHFPVHQQRRGMEKPRGSERAGQRKRLKRGVV